MVEHHEKFNDNSINGLDKELSASVKKILLQRIIFKDAQVPDEGDVLNHKYKPLNASYNPHQVKLNLKNNLCNKTSTDIPNPPTVIYPEEKIELQWKGIRKIGPGLANLGNTCFLNSVLQVLTYTPPLVNYILSDYHKNKCKTVGFCMQCELSNHINKVLHHGQQMGAVRPMSIIQKLKCIGKNFSFGRQEDAHEFLRYVVEGVQKSDYANRPKLDKLSRETTVANAIFGGYYRSQVKCLHCHYESNTFDPMMDLNLDTKDVSSIVQALQRSTRPDRLDGENKYFCEKCRTKRVAQKRGTIHKEPNVLTLQLKRFDFSKMFGGKVCKEISFPEELNIRPYMSIPQGEPIVYKLYSILVHSGYSCNSGHYYCYVKAPNGIWYEMNDNRVCQVGLQTVLHAQAYILFYVRSGEKINMQTSVTKSSISKNDLQRPQPKPCSNGIQRPQPKPFVNGIQKTEPKTCTNDIQRPQMKPRAISDFDKRTINPLGVLLKRKSEPKINWTQNQKIPIKSAEVASLILNNTDVEKSSQNVTTTKEKSEHLTDKKSVKMPLACSVDNKKEIHKDISLNGLEKLHESYGDSDSAPSGATSPASSKLEDLKHNKDEEKVVEIDHSNNSIPDNTNATDQTGHSSNSKNESFESKTTPFKLKLKNGKQFIHNKLNIWSPITKGTLFPRAIVNKNIFENESDYKTNPTVKKKMLDLSWKEEKISNPEKLFGPLMPPPPGTKCQGSNSITSEASSTGSIQTQSGEWDVLDKDCDISTSNISTLPVGWEVRTPRDTSKIVDAEIQPIPVEIEDRKSKKKKKKKKHRHREDITEQIISRKHDRSIDDYSSRKEYSHSSINKLEDRERYEHHQKKKARKEKLKIESSLVIPYSTAIPIISEAENIPHKKKKKKHKRKYTLLIDTSSSDTGKLYKFPSSMEEELSKYEVSPSGKQHISVNKFYSKNDARKSHHNDAIISFDNPTFDRSKSYSTPNKEVDNSAFKISRSHSVTSNPEIDNPAFKRSNSYSSILNQDAGNSAFHRTKSHSVTPNPDADNSAFYRTKSHSITPNPDAANSAFNRSKSNSSTPPNQEIDNQTLNRSKSHSVMPNREIDNPALNRSKSHPSTPNREVDNQTLNRSKSHSNTPNREVDNSPVKRSKSYPSTPIRQADNQTFNRSKSHSVTPNREADIQEDSNNKDENKFPKKREIPSYSWDDPKKKICSWDGSAKSDTVDYLLGGGTKVKSWDDSDRSMFYNSKNRRNGEVAVDEWDEEYDRGKTRKKRTLDDHQDDYHKSKLNSFQHLQNYKNQTKDVYATHRNINNHYTDRHYPNKKRKLYSDGNRFL